jgi:hypothetical protein
MPRWNGRVSPFCGRRRTRRSRNDAPSPERGERGAGAAKRGGTGSASRKEKRSMKDQNGLASRGGRTEAARAFHLMWDAFPYLVLLLEKDRTIVASNRAAVKMGALPGMKCYEWHKHAGVHPHCKGNAALESGTAMRSVGAYRDRVLDSYWIPAGDGELMIHFSIDITPYAKEELFREPL